MSTPLELIYDALWDCLSANAGFSALVATSNRIRYDGRGPEPDFDVAAPGAYPRVRIVPAPEKTQPRPQWTSTSSNPIFVWRIEVRTGEQRIDYLLQLWWHIYVALLDWKTYLGPALTYGGVQLVYNVLPAATSEQQDLERETNQGTNQWTSLWNVQTEISLPTSVIRSP